MGSGFTCISVLDVCCCLCPVCLATRVVWGGLTLWETVGFKRDFVVCGLFVLVWVFAFELVGFGLAGCIVCGWLRELWLCCWVWVGVSGLILYVVGVCVPMVARSGCLFYCWYC